MTEKQTGEQMDEEQHQEIERGCNCEDCREQRERRRRSKEEGEIEYKYANLTTVFDCARAPRGHLQGFDLPATVTVEIQVLSFGPAYSVVLSIDERGALVIRHPVTPEPKPCEECARRQRIADNCMGAALDTPEPKASG